MTSPSKVFGKLGAPLHNVVWSWGAARPDGAIFLRVWQDETRKLADGSIAVMVGHHEDYHRVHNNLGYNERVRHIAAVAAGAPGYVIFCKAKDVTADPREIESIDTRDVIRLGNILEIDGNEWGVLAERVAMRSL